MACLLVVALLFADILLPFVRLFLPPSALLCSCRYFCWQIPQQWVCLEGCFSAPNICLAAGGWLGSLGVKGPPACSRLTWTLSAWSKGSPARSHQHASQEVKETSAEGFMQARSEICSHTGKEAGAQADSKQVQIQDKLCTLCCIMACVSLVHEPRGTTCFSSLSCEHSTDTRGSAPFPLGGCWRQELSRAKENKTMFA